MNGYKLIYKTFNLIALILNGALFFNLTWSLLTHEKFLSLPQNRNICRAFSNFYEKSMEQEDLTSELLWTKFLDTFL